MFGGYEISKKSLCWFSLVSLMTVHDNEDFGRSDTRSVRCSRSEGDGRYVWLCWRDFGSGLRAFPVVLNFSKN